MRKVTILAALAAMMVLGVLGGGCGDDESPSFGDRYNVGDELERRIAYSKELIDRAKAAQERLSAADKPETAELLKAVNAALRSAKHAHLLMERQYEVLYEIKTRTDLMAAGEATNNLSAAAECLTRTIIVSEAMIKNGPGARNERQVESLFCASGVVENYPVWYGGKKRRTMEIHRDLLLKRQRSVAGETVRFLAIRREEVAPE
ncbi:MAG: hypothetical protein ABIJ57_03525 [Pseudomonadota bacterium]